MRGGLLIIWAFRRRLTGDLPLHCSRSGLIQRPRPSSSARGSSPPAPSASRRCVPSCSQVPPRPVRIPEHSDYRFRCKPTEQCMPAMVDDAILRDMGRMNARSLWVDTRGCSPAPTAAASAPRGDVHPHRHRQAQRRRPTGLARRWSQAFPVPPPAPREQPSGARPWAPPPLARARDVVAGGCVGVTLVRSNPLDLDAPATLVEVTRRPSTGLDPHPAAPRRSR